MIYQALTLNAPPIICSRRQFQIVRFFKNNKTNSTNLYPLTKGYLRETCKSQNINAINLTLSSPSVLFRS